MEIEIKHNPLEVPRFDDDEPESDDQGLMWNTPLNAKPLLKAEDFDISENTGMTSPCSSSKTHDSLQSRDFTVQFSDDHNILEIDCDYTDEQVCKLWFAKEEYDDFLEACDEDAQKHEEYEKETRVNKLKKEIRRQRRQRQKEEKHTPRIRAAEALDESINSQARFELDEDIYDDSEDSEDDDSLPEYDEDQEGWLCPLGLEAWTLDGYKAREHHRQKAIDSVLNEQYAAWDRGMIENMEMMSALYFAASAISKHEAHKKAKELEDDIQHQTVVSTLEDYNKAVQTLNVLQKSLACIKTKQKEKDAKAREAEIRPLSKRRGSTGGIGIGSVQKRRGSTGSVDSDSALSSSSPSPINDRGLATMEKPVDQAPQLPTKSSYPPQTSSSSSSRKKFTQRKINGSDMPQKIYKSKAQTEIIFMPPTPPVTKKPAVVYKPSKGGAPQEFDAPLMAPMTKSPKVPTKSPKHRKIVYKPVVDGPPKYEGSRCKSIETETTKKKKKKKTKDPTKSTKKYHSNQERTRSESPQPRELKKGTRPRSKSPFPSDLLADTRPRSKSPRPRELKKGTRARSKSPCPSDLYADSSLRSPRSKSPRPRDLSGSKHSSLHSRSSESDRERRRSKSPHARVVSADRLRSPRTPKANGTKESKDSSFAGKLLKKMGAKRPKSPSKTKGYAPLSNHSASPHQSSKKEHWWYQQQRQACQ